MIDVWNPAQMSSDFIMQLHHRCFFSACSTATKTHKINLKSYRPSIRDVSIETWNMLVNLDESIGEFCLQYPTKWWMSTQMGHTHTQINIKQHMCDPEWCVPDICRDICPESLDNNHFLEPYNFWLIEMLGDPMVIHTVHNACSSSKFYVAGIIRKASWSISKVQTWHILD